MLDFLLNTIRCPHKLLLCCHQGTRTSILYIVITKTSTWLFQHITPWLQNCVCVCGGKEEKKQQLTGQEISASSIKQTPDTRRFNKMNSCEKKIAAFPLWIGVLGQCLCGERERAPSIRILREPGISAHKD